MHGDYSGSGNSSFRFYTTYSFSSIPLLIPSYIDRSLFCKSRCHLQWQDPSTPTLYMQPGGVERMDRSMQCPSAISEEPLRGQGLDKHLMVRVITLHPGDRAQHWAAATPWVAPPATRYSRHAVCCLDGQDLYEKPFVACYSGVARLKRAVPCARSPSTLSHTHPRGGPRMCFFCFPYSSTLYPVQSVFSTLYVGRWHRK